MKISVDNELKEICKLILFKNKTLNEWKLIEADDYFRTCNYEGGFDATEEAFCFSYYDTNKTEWWFQLTLQEIEKIYSNNIEQIDIRKSKI